MAKRIDNGGIPKNATFGPRVQFNGGFHDATRDTLAGTPRQVSDTLSPQTITRAQGYYFDGYCAGVKAMGEAIAAGVGVRPDYSTDAWRAFRDAHPNREALRAEIDRAEIDELAHCLRRRRDDPYVKAKAKEYAAQTWDA